MKNGKDHQTPHNKLRQEFSADIVEELEAEDDTLGRATFNMAATEVCEAKDR